MVNVPARSITAASDKAAGRAWLTLAIPLALGLFAYGLIFWVEISAAISVWLNSDAYNHCFLVLPVAGYLAWERRSAAAATTPRPSLPLALLAVPVAAAWFAAERLGIMEGRQLMAMTLVEVMFLALLGWEAWKALAVPLLYLFFLVPFGDFFVPALQDVVVWFTTVGIDFLSIPNVSDGVIIQIPEGTFIVHQACSGLRFLIASLAFGVLYACVIYTSPIRRMLFIAVSLAVAIVGNCLRVLGTIVIAHFIGNAEAVETNHVLWGWLFYVIIGAVLVLIGLIFRQQEVPRAEVDLFPSDQRTGNLKIAFIAVILVSVATLPRAGAAYLNALGEDSGPAARISLPSITGCTQAPIPAEVPVLGAEPGPGSWISSAYRCDGEQFIVTLRRYPPRIGVRALFASLRTATIPPGWDIIFQTGDFQVAHGTSSSVWRLTEGSTTAGYSAVAMALWLDGRPSGTGLRARVDQAINSFWGASTSPGLLIATNYGANSLNGAAHAIQGFLSKTEPLVRLVSKPALGEHASDSLGRRADNLFARNHDDLVP